LLMSRAPCLLRYLSVLPVVHEKPEEGLIHPPGRAHNRIRSPRLAAPGRAHNRIRSPRLAAPGRAHNRIRSPRLAAPGRAHNRIRSPRLAASGLWNELGEGSRQIGSGTLGKGLALRGGCGDPCVLCTVRTDCWTRSVLLSLFSHDEQLA